jgi:hypothetical protein
MGTLPTKIQRELFEHAASLADLKQTAPPKGQIARFLHAHKDDGDQTPLRAVCDGRRALLRELTKSNAVSAERVTRGNEGTTWSHGGLPLRRMFWGDEA